MKKEEIEIKIRKILYEKMDSFLVEGDKPREIGRLNLDRHLFVDTTTAEILELLKSEKDRWRRRDISLCSADILRAQEIERNKCKSEKEKLIERIKKIKSPIMKEEYFRELPSLKGIWYAGFSAGKKIILEKLKEEIKKEVKVETKK